MSSNAELLRRYAKVLVGSVTLLVLLAWQADQAKSVAQTARVVRVVNSSGPAGGVARVPVVIESQGDEVGLQFTLNFNPSLLTFQRAEAGSDAQNNQFFETNQSQIGQGRVGVLLLLRNPLQAGSRQLVMIDFQIAGGASSGQSAPLTFGNEPIRQRVIDANAEPLLASFVGGEVAITPPPCTLEITSFNPTSGSAGTNVTITGRGFTGVNSVKFANNVTATFNVNSDTQITVTVPSGAVNGPITISKPNCPDAQSNTIFTVGPTPLTRAVRIVCLLGATRGGTLVLPIELVSQGDENGLGFSFSFDPAVLSNPRVTLGADASGALLNVNPSRVGQGHLGLGLALPSGQTFAVGVRRIAVVTFTVSATTTGTSTSVDFGDVPIAREVVNPNAQFLTATYQSCPNIIIGTPGYEADVAPRPNGSNDGTVTISDWVQAGRFVAGLDTAAAGSEFQRADCAPREAKGNGQLSIADWVQAGRYAAGLDSVQTSGGPTGPTALALALDEDTTQNASAHSRVVRILNATFQRGRPNTLELEIEAEGDENAIGLSLNFDSSALTFVSAAAGSGAPNAVLNVNANQAASGRLGLALALPAGQTLRAGKQTIVIVRFNAPAGSNAAATTIGFGDAPIRRQLSDVNAVAVAASYGDGSINFVNSVSNVSAASFRSEIAAESIVAAFGAGLATTTASAATLPLPTSLAGTTVKVKDSAGVERLAPLFFVAPSQVNYLAPPEAAPGAATVTITSGNGAVSVGTISIATVAPSLFAANSDGQGVGAMVVVRVRPDGSQVFESAVRFDPAQNKFVAAPIDLGAEDEQVVLLMFGTGFRNRSALSAVSVSVGGVNAPVDYVGPQPGFAGLDQINARLPRSLAGRSEVDVVVTVDGRTANTIKAFIK
jgi:uncharacterized protein (TIGR03437 family)